MINGYVPFYLEVFISVFIVSSHNTTEMAAVIGLIIPYHYQDPDPLTGLPLEHLPHVGVTVHLSLLNQNWFCVQCTLYCTHLSPDQANASKHAPARDVDQLFGLFVKKILDISISKQLAKNRLYV